MSPPKAVSSTATTRSPQTGAAPTSPGGLKTTGATPGQQFEKMLTAQFLWYATHTLSPAQGDRGNAATWTARARRMPGTWWKASAGSTASPARRCPPSTPKAAPGMGGRDDPPGQAGQRQPRRGPKDAGQTAGQPAGGRPLPLGQRLPPASRGRGRSPPTGTWTGRQLCWRGAGWTVPTRPFSPGSPGKLGPGGAL